MTKGGEMKQPFEKVVEQHGGTVLRLCRALLGVHDAEDAEIAEILGGTTDAVRRAAADGVKSLRKKYPGAATKGAPA